MINKIVLENENNFISFNSLNENIFIDINALSNSTIEFKNKNRDYSVLIVVNNTCDLKLILEENTHILITIVIKKQLNLKIECLANSNVEINTIIYSRENLSNDIISDLKGENAILNMNTLDYLNAQTIHQNNIIINHLNKNTEGKMSNSLVAKNGGKLILNGISKIIRGSKLSNARQENRGVLLDNISTIKAIPCLLIDEFDCQASHGAAIGKISDEGLFYLMSRGLNKKESLKLIMEGFINPFMDKVSDEIVKEQIKEFLNE